MKSIYGLFGSGAHVSEQEALDLGTAMASHVEEAIAERRPRGILRASNLGTKCERKLWYTVNTPEKAEPVEPHAQNKFLYGHLIEEYILWMLKKAGHKVEKRQETVGITLPNGKTVEGHIDCILDGRITDVKSANSRNINKFKYHKLEQDDPFGYIDQLDFYRAALDDDPAVSDKDNVQFVAIDKELGHVVLDEYNRSHVSIAAIKAKVQTADDMCSLPEPPARGYFAEPDGKSGNLQLCMECRYCEYKWTCWPSLRKFIYSNGPRWLVKVLREPDVPEDTNRHRT